MNLIKQTNRWSCLPTSFAMVMDVDINIIIAEVGHDGSDILYPLSEEPYRRRGFHIQELIHVAWNFGWYSTPFEILPTMTHQTIEPYRLVKIPRRKIEKLLEWNSGILLGLNNHAVAWSHVELKVFNPSGRIEEIDQFKFSTFYSLNRC